MAIESSESVELEARRAELKAVLESTEFLRAPTLAHLLSYVCEKFFAGEANQIKEYSIGVEVFHRGASFDQDSDSIVRVHANRLRKRLADYYAGEGAGHLLRICIPVGQYVPRFMTVASPATPDGVSSSPGPTAGQPAVEKSSGRLRRNWTRGVLIAAIAAVPLLGLIWFLLRQPARSGPAAESTPSAAQSAEMQFGPPVGQEIRILAGANRSFVDHAGKLWNADAWFNGGTEVKSTGLHIWRTQEQGFYRTSRQGQFRYDIPIKKGVYELRLHFAETVYSPESSSTGGEGSRIMTVRANGKTLLAGFDIVADAGASRTADIKVFPDMAPAPDGMLHLEFSAENGGSALLSAIEILPGVHGRMLPIRVLPRQTPYYSNDSRWWSPDNYFQGGQLAVYSAPASGTDDPDLYEAERWGNFTYAIPVSPGKYTLTLYFAARHAGSDRSPSEASQTEPDLHRVFNVFCNGQALLQNFDLSKEAQRKDVVVKTFNGLAPNAQGKLLLSFVPVQGYATVSGIEVLPQ